MGIIDGAMYVKLAPTQKEMARRVTRFLARLRIRGRNLRYECHLETHQTPPTDPIQQYEDTVQQIALHIFALDYRPFGVSEHVGLAEK